MTHHEEKDWNDSFRAGSFVRTFTYREVLTSFMVSLLYFALADLVFYFGGPYTGNWLLIPGAIVSHIVYRREHSRSNNYVGRILHDGLLILFYLVINRLLAAVVGRKNPLETDVGEFVSVLVGVVIVVAFCEAVVGLLKLTPVLRKWQIL